MHRANKACAACHDLIDPVGFALENFDAVGRLRTFDGTLAIDSRGNLPDGTQISTVAEVEKNILIRPEIFVQTVTERLMTYGLGRAVEPEDGSVVRGIVEAASHDEYRLRSIIKGIVLSPPFRMRSVVSP
jgi:hypothetical protein